MKKEIQSTTYKSVIIAGLATIGKTFLSKKYDDILDLEIGDYKYDCSNSKNIDYEKLKGTRGRKKNKN